MISKLTNFSKNQEIQEAIQRAKEEERARQDVGHRLQLINMELLTKKRNLEELRREMARRRIFASEMK
jgi:hypothetical protein